MRRKRPNQTASERDHTDSSEPGRMCVISRQAAEKGRLLRFVLGPDGQLFEDLAGKLSGRGYYVVPTADAIVKLHKRFGSEKGLDFEPILLRIGQGLQRRLLDGLSLARRSGNLRWGLRGVQESVEALASPLRGRSGAGSAEMLWLLAADSASNTREKFEGQRRKLSAMTQKEPEVFELLDRDHFGTVCGGEKVAILVVTQNGMVRRVREDILRWNSFLTPGPGKSAGKR
ncbi:MAG: DUF448 domain-containing protein [Magnetococcales bacterium]|nr:DUF448 domain-containing protein [Magnetococcales bacterium]